jgi:hypothetical protein
MLHELRINPKTSQNNIELLLKKFHMLKPAWLFDHH